MEPSITPEDTKQSNELDIICL